MTTKHWKLAGRDEEATYFSRGGQASSPGLLKYRVPLSLGVFAAGCPLCFASLLLLIAAARG
jgi:hypothetical protein